MREVETERKRSTDIVLRIKLNCLIFLYEIRKLCTIQVRILFVLVSWIGARRKNDQAVVPCAIKAKRSCVLLVLLLQCHTRHTAAVARRWQWRW